MAHDYASGVRKNNEIVAALEASGAKQPDMPLGPKYLERVAAKFGGKKRSPGNSGGTGRSGRRKKRLYLGVGSGIQWSGPPKTGK